MYKIYVQISVHYFLPRGLRSVTIDNVEIMFEIIFPL